MSDKKPAAPQVSKLDYKAITATAAAETGLRDELEIVIRTPAARSHETNIRIGLDGMYSTWAFDEMEQAFRSCHWPDLAKLRAADAVRDLQLALKQRGRRKKYL